jgi:hypothetical protein|tara:strand:- start:1044 stop:1340 length:297 start_codon:yes stop_codon:yes gene_type:complete
MTKKAVITSQGLKLIDLDEAEEIQFSKAENEAQKNMNEKLKGNIRATREFLFQEADIEIFKLEDSGGDTSAWRAYRQQLRDMTNQSDLENPIYPKKPS